MTDLRRVAVGEDKSVPPPAGGSRGVVVPDRPPTHAQSDGKAQSRDSRLSFWQPPDVAPRPHRSRTDWPRHPGPHSSVEVPERRVASPAGAPRGVQRQGRGLDAVIVAGGEGRATAGSNMASGGTPPVSRGPLRPNTSLVDPGAAVGRPGESKRPQEPLLQSPLKDGQGHRGHRAVDVAHVAAAEEDMARAFHLHSVRGTFTDPAQETAFRRDVWAEDTRPRVLSAVAMVAASVAGAVTALSQLLGVLPTWKLATGLILLLTGVVGLGLTVLVNRRRAEYSPRLQCATAASFTLLAVTLVVLLPMTWCGDVPHDNIAMSLGCNAMPWGSINWRPMLVTLLFTIIQSGPVGVNWLTNLPISAAIAIGAVATVVAQGSVLFFTVEGGFGMIASVVVSTYFARARQASQRRSWAALETAARYGVSRDRAERHKLSAIRKMAEAEAQTITFRRVTRYVCHELRNPLHGIMGLLEGVAEETPLPQWAREDLETCSTTASHMSTILNDVLDLGQLQQGRMKLSPVPVDPARVIENSVTSLHRLACVRLGVYVSPSVPTTLNLDPLRFGQIVTNLVSNALKLTQSGTGVEVFVFIAQKALHVEVLDTGPGLGAKSSANLFKPYAQVDSGQSRRTNKRFEKGTGLGLVITAALVKLMGGTIGLENRDDGQRGARSWVRIPLVNLQDTGAVSLGPSQLAPAASLRRMKLQTRPTPMSMRSLVTGDTAAAALPSSPADASGDHTGKRDIVESFHAKILEPRPRPTPTGSDATFDDPIGSGHVHEVSGSSLTAELGSGGLGQATPDSIVRRSGRDDHLAMPGSRGCATSPAAAAASLTSTALSGVSGSDRPKTKPRGREAGVSPPDARSESKGGDHPPVAAVLVAHPSRRRHTDEWGRGSGSGSGAGVAATEQMRPRVCICDDEAINRRILSRHAKKCGFTALHLSDGDELLAMVQRGGVRDGCLVDLDRGGQPFAAVFLDIMMERTSGEEVLAQLKSAGVTQTPIIAATGNGLKEDVDRFKRSFAAVMLKPFTGAAVRSTLSAVGAIGESDTHEVYTGD